MSECKIDQLDQLKEQIGCPSYHETSWRKSALIQKSSAQIPRLFYQQRIVENKKNDLGTNTLI